jgi:hypothetical protein
MGNYCTATLVLEGRPRRAGGQPVVVYPSLATGLESAGEALHRVRTSQLEALCVCYQLCPNLVTGRRTAAGLVLGACEGLPMWESRQKVKGRHSRPCIHTNRLVGPPTLPNQPQGGQWSLVGIVGLPEVSEPAMPPPQLSHLNSRATTCPAVCLW